MPSSEARFLAMRERYDVWYPVEVECPAAALPGYRLRVEGVGVRRGVVRVEYRIDPAFTPVAGGPVIWWDWGAEDELGTEYDQAGGAYGSPPESEGTEGELSVVPVPPPDARRLTLTLNPTLEPDPWNPTTCVIEVDLTAGVIPEQRPEPSVAAEEAGPPEPGPGVPLIERVGGEGRTAARRIPVGHACPDAWNGHHLRIEAVEISAVGVLVEFSFEPMLDFTSTLEMATPESTPPTFRAVDDLGNEYEGDEVVFSDSADGLRTEGLCALPPASGATSLTFALVPRILFAPPIREGCEFRVSIE